MANSILGIDHMIIGVNDLARARSAYGRLGFTVAPLGDHVGKATANHCLMFADTYLELLGINEPGLADTTSLAAFLDNWGEGFVKMALGTPDADAARADIARAGFTPEGPLDLSRPLDDPPGAVVRFRNLQIPEEETARLSTFLCGHLTPDLMRPPPLTEHANGAEGIHSITALVDDVAPFAGPWSRLFGADAAETPFGLTFDMGRGRLHLATPEGLGRIHPGATVDPARERPYYLAVRIATPSPADAAAAAEANGVRTHRLDDCVRIDPSDACGVLLEFVAA